jgi:hypothetical protein
MSDARREADLLKMAKAIRELHGPEIPAAVYCGRRQMPAKSPEPSKS